MSTGDHPSGVANRQTGPDPRRESGPIRRPRVGLNAHLLSRDETYRSAGVSRYIHYLLTYLPQVDARLSYVAFLGTSLYYPGWHTRVSSWRTEQPVVRILWEQFAQPWGARQERLDLLHAPVYVGPILAPCPLVVTVHDLSFYRYPQTLPPLRRIYLQQLTRHTVRRAAHVIADSQSVLKDIVDVLGLPESKISVIPLGVEETLRPLEDQEQMRAFRQRHSLPERTILYLGTLEPRKNITTLLEAYELLCHERGFAHSLVIAGGKGWYYEKIYARAEQLGLQDKVIFPGYIPQEELALWINAADLFVYPSWYEGFGLPPLEAMACGTPVIVSDTPALREVVGDAGVIVDPHDPQALAKAIAEVLQDREFHQILRDAGLARAKQFSWKATALRTARLYQWLLGDEQVHDA